MIQYCIKEMILMERMREMETKKEVERMMVSEQWVEEDG